MAVLALLLAVFLTLESRLPLRTAIQIGGDEGFELAKAILCLHGYKLYTDVWNDQPPLHTFLITQILKWRASTDASRTNGKDAFHSVPDPLSPSNATLETPLPASPKPAQSILAPRLVTVAFAALLLTSMFWLALRLSGLLIAALTTGLLIASPGFLGLSASCMLEIPALATAVASLCILSIQAKERATPDPASLRDHPQNVRSGVVRSSTSGSFPRFVCEIIAGALRKELQKIAQPFKAGLSGHSEHKSRRDERK